MGKDGDWFKDGVLANSSSQEIVSKCKGLYFRYIMKIMMNIILIYLIMMISF